MLQKQCSLSLTDRFCWTTEPGWTMWPQSRQRSSVVLEHAHYESGQRAWGCLEQTGGRASCQKWTLPEGQYSNLPYDVWEVLAEAIVEQGGVSVGPKPGNADFLEHWGALPLASSARASTRPCTSCCFKSTLRGWPMRWPGTRFPRCRTCAAIRGRARSSAATGGLWKSKS